LFEPDATVSACTRTWLIQVYVNFWMTQGTSATVANRFPPLHESYRFLRDELHRAQWVRLEVHCSLFESWSRSRPWTRTLARRPSCGVVWSLLNHWCILLFGNSSIVGFDSSTRCRCRGSALKAFQRIVETVKGAAAEHGVVNGNFQLSTRRTFHFWES